MTHTGSTGSLPPSQVHRLRQEVEMGTCDLALVRSEPVRTVSITAIKILQEAPGALDDGNEINQRFLVEVAKLERGVNAIKTSCVLPGTKRREQEPAKEAVQRVLDGDLAEL